MRTLRYVTLDVFTSTPFAGNPLAVVWGAESLPTETLQAITREFNYSETVFVFAAKDSTGGRSPEELRAAERTRSVRIFTPARELPFAGHPTLGCAHALVALGEIPAMGADITVVLEEGVGPVPVTLRLVDGMPVHAQFTTAQPPEERTADVPTIEQLASVLSLDVTDFVGGAMSPAGVSCGIPFLIVPLVSVDAVKRARVVMDAWDQHLRDSWASEPMVFAHVTSDDGSTDDVSSVAGTSGGSRTGEELPPAGIRARVFVPGLSVPEDPATGSANACLAAYLASRTSDSDVPADGVLRWEVAQGVEMGRPSRLSLEAEKRGGTVGAIRVGGASVLVNQGTMTLPD